MADWLASDLHFNHRNILSYCPDRRMGRSFPVVENPEDKDEVAYKAKIVDGLVHDMNEVIVSNWNSKVAPKDTVWIIGDVAMGLIDKAPDLIRRLNGTKHLIRGNHDKTLSKRIRNGDEGFVGLFESVRDYFELSHKVDGKKHMLCMSHFPMSHWNGMNQGTMMIHGHLHGNPSGLTGRIKDVGIDTNNLFPYKIDDVVRELLEITVIRDHHND